jgi:CheY-like chemotaxis protein
MDAPSLGTVLIVEDDPATRDMVVTLMTLAGFRAVWAEDGLEALHLLRAVRHREPKVPCLILLDLLMPRLGGREFRRAQLDDPVVAGVPVVLMTGAVDADAESAGLRAVATLTKPLDPDRVIHTVRQYCVAFSDAGHDGAPQGIGQ